MFNIVNKHPSKMTEKEKEEILSCLDVVGQIEEDLAYWQELADLLGWKVYGFTFKNSASFETSRTGYANTIQLSGRQRDDIVRAIRNGL